MFFGRTKPKEKTILVVDVESGSVGSALARVSSTHPPRLFGEWRTHLPVLHARDTNALARGVEQASEEAIAHASEVAARLRLREQTADLGTIDRAALFLSPPWGIPNLREGKPSFFESLTRPLRNLIGAHAGSVPATFHTHAGAIVRGMNTLFQTPGYVLLCSVHGEVTELTLLKDGDVVGHGTLPVGIHSLVRTLRAHGGISEHETRSLLRLSDPHHAEPLESAARHFREMFRATGEPLFGGHPVSRVHIFTRGPESQWFARSLSHDSLEDLFPEGGTIHVVRAEHFTPFVAAHAEHPDSALLLNTLFVA